MASKTNKSESLEKQVEAAVDAGLISSTAAGAPAKKTRGRPKTKSVEPQPDRLLPEEKKFENEKKLQQVIANSKKKRLIQQLKAFSVYFPEVCNDAINLLTLEELDADQLQRLYENLEESVLGYSEITSIPIAIKKVLGNVESGLVGLGANNPEHPVFGELLKLHGLSRNIETDYEIDRNVKLVAVKLAGRMPRNPYINILTGIVRVAVETFQENVKRYNVTEFEDDPRYSKITNPIKN